MALHRDTASLVEIAETLTVGPPVVPRTYARGQRLAFACVALTMLATGVASAQWNRASFGTQLLLLSAWGILTVWLGITALSLIISIAKGRRERLKDRLLPWAKLAVVMSLFTIWIAADLGRQTRFLFKRSQLNKSAEKLEAECFKARAARNTNDTFVIETSTNIRGQNGPHNVTCGVDGIAIQLGSGSNFLDFYEWGFKKGKVSLGDREDASDLSGGWSYWRVYQDRF